MECSDSSSVYSSSDTDISSSKKRLKCPEKGCQASFTKNYKLTIHIRKHTGERPFICDEEGCNKTYTNSSHLRRHKKVSHGEKELQHIMCEYEGCGLILANRYSLKKHYNRKHNIDNYEFVCTECSQGFHRKKQLQQHSYLHTGEAPFKCNDCNMSFTTNQNFNKHKRSHKTYTCDCGEIFTKWSLMLSHKKSCKQPKFECEVCNKKFANLANYKNHKLVHKEKSEKSVFTCPYTACGRYYFYKKNLKYHVDNFHKKINDDVRYKCTYPKCKIVLKTKQCLKMHLRKHFQWVRKKQRKTRCDKGKPKKSMVSVLTGQKELERDSIDHNTKDNINDNPEVNLENNQLCMTDHISDGQKELEKDSANHNTKNNIDDNLNISLEDNQLCVSDQITDEGLLKECELALSLLNEKLVAAS